MYDSIIIGAGPAGITAAIYAKRANKNVLIFYFSESNIEKAEKIDNYYGFENGISGKELYKRGINQAINLGIDVKNEEVLEIQNIDETFTIKTPQNEYKSKTLILATRKQENKTRYKRHS